MSEKLHAIWPVLAEDGVGDAIGDARPTFVVSIDGRFLQFANAAGARFLKIAPARTLDARLTLEPRLAERLGRFAATARPGERSRELIRFFDGLRSSLLSAGFRRLAGDTVLVTIDNARLDPADADPAASLAGIAAEGGLVALFDGDGEVVVALGDHTALDGVQEEIEAALDADDGEAVFERRFLTGTHAHDVTLVRLGDAAHPRRLLRVGPPVAITADEPEDAAEIAEHGIGAAEARTGVEPAKVAPATPETLEAAVPPTALPPEVAGASLAVTADSKIAEIETPEAAPMEPAAFVPVAEAALLEPPVPAAEAIAMVVIDETPTGGEAVEVGDGPAVTAAVEDAFEETTPELTPECLAEAGAEPVATDEVVAATHEEPSGAAEEDVEPAPALSGYRHRRIDRPVKFVWQMDAERRFTLVSEEFAAAVGPRAAAIVGRSWNEVAADFGLDPEGRVTAALERRDTWSGRTVSWPIEGEALRLPVDLAALPAFDRGRVFAGYRGFGTVRADEPIPDPTATGLRLATPAPGSEVEHPVAESAKAQLPLSAPASPATLVPPQRERVATDAGPEAAQETETSPPSHPDDTEVVLAEAARLHAEDERIDAGEAAFAGEIDEAPALADTRDPTEATGGPDTR
ncbi:MAG: hypothetical protein OEL76_18400, partial [Siculibacillus sp.]|nr:hypothetical protein [Siculibacillus sp.]